MSGAAGAPVTIAPATPLGTMSAQAVLSMIAPTLPATPQGPSDADASAFEGLLATVLAADGAAPAAAGVAPLPATGEATADDTAPQADGVDLSGLPGFLTAALPAAASPVIRTGAEPSVAADDAGSVPAPVAAPESTSGASMSSAIAPTPANGAGLPALPGTATAAPPEPQAVAATTSDKAPEPQVVAAAPVPVPVPAPQVPAGTKPARSATPQIPPVAASSDDAQPALPTGDAIQTATSEEDSPSAPPVKSGAVPAPAPSALPAPPLRPLAERTSKPLDQAAQVSISAAPTEAKTAVSTPTPPSTPADSPSKPAAPAASAAPAAPAADPGSPPAEPAPTGEAAPGQTEAAAPARDHSLSTLSRATIDATAQIAAQILRKLEGRSTRFEIALRPDELGRVDVKLDIDAEGRLAARLAFDNPVAATDLRGRVDDLRRQLEAAGFQLAEDAFEFAERDSGSSAFDRGQDARQGQNRAFAAAARLNADIDVAQPPQWLALSLSPSGVDMKV